MQKLTLKIESEEFEEELKMITDELDPNATMPQAINIYIETIGKQLWIARWKRYRTKSSDQMKESIDWRGLTSTRDMKRDACACIRYDKERVADTARRILEETTLAKEITRRN